MIILTYLSIWLHLSSFCHIYPYYPAWPYLQLFCQIKCFDAININHYLDIQYILSQNAPVCAHNFVQCVICEHMSFTDISIIVVDFLCRQVSSYDACRHCVKNADERRYSYLLYYLRKYSHMHIMLLQNAETSKFIL